MINKSLIAVLVVAVVMVAAVGVILTAPTNEADELEITIVAQVNSEGSGIFVSNDITNETDLGGKVFATPGTSSIQHMMFMDYVISLGYDFAIATTGTLDNNTVYWTAIGPALMKAAMIAGTIDGGIAWEPYVSDILLDASADAKILKWSSELWEDHPCCVLAVSTAYLEENPETVLRFVAAHVVATQWLIDTVADNTSANYTHLVEIAAEFAGVDNDTIESALAEVKYDSAMGNDWLLSLEQVVETYDDLGVLTEGAMESWGFTNYSDVVDALVDGSFLANASTVTTGETNLTDVRVGWLNGDIHQLARLVAMDEEIGEGLGYGDNTTIYEAYGLNIISGSGNPYANGGAVMDAFYADVIDIGFLGSPPAILRSINQV